MNRRPSYLAGLHLGPSGSPSALVICERPFVEWFDPPAQKKPSYSVRHLQRWALGTAYTTIVEEVDALFRHPSLRNCIVGINSTVGRPVVDQFRARVAVHPGYHPQSCLITTGETATYNETEQTVHVPRKELITQLQLLLQLRRVRFAQELPLAATLVRELENFRTKAAARDVYDAWVSDRQEDLVMALSLALWLGEMAIPLVPPPGYERVVGAIGDEPRFARALWWQLREGESVGALTGGSFKVQAR